MQQIAMMTGWQLAAEDPAWRPGETASLVSGSDPDWARAQAALPGRTLRFEFSPADGAEQVLTRLVASYREQGFPGAFRVAPSGAGLAITPKSDSPLGARVRIPLGERSFAETVKMLTKQLEPRIADGLSLLPGGWTKERLEFGADGEPARDVLNRLAAAVPGRTLLWRLQYHPRSGYALRWSMMRRSMVRWPQRVSLSPQ